MYADMSYSLRKAVFFTLLAVTMGLVGTFVFVTDWSVSLPLVIFYVILVINTYPSVRLFSSLIPIDDGKHALADFLLGGLFLFLPMTFGDPIQFTLCALVLFLGATGKYSLMLDELPHQRLLTRKIRIELLGVLMCASVLALMNFGFVLSAAWALAIIFAIANVYVLVLRPLYKI
jgi:hypothetical protein